ncbi:site-2 protease family protein [Haloferula sp. BvORR071]|uniref:site-2 protease family protein n=1 Tax=Haloferula sp. BvORR071 TaxID=1396141 RepID=UPI0005538B1F|nr:site-2 protease family protein [Haloferula sp. BvORR071]
MLALGIFPLDALPGWFLTFYLGTLLLSPLPLLVVTAAKLRTWFLPQHTAADPATLPANVRRQIQPWIGRLGFLGYAFQNSSRSLDENKRDCFIYRFASVNDRSLAVVKVRIPSSSPKAKAQISLSLFAFLPDGGVIVTADRAIAPSRPEHWQLCHRRFTTVEAQLLEHRSRLEGQPVIFIPQQQIGARLAHEEQAVPEALIASGNYSPLSYESQGAKPAFTARPKLAWRQLAAFFSGAAAASGRRTDLAAAAKPGELEQEQQQHTPSHERSTEDSVEDQLNRYRELTTSSAGRKYYASRIGATTLTLALCVAFIGKSDPLETAAIVLAVLATHEFGHWLMLKIFGFKGMGRFFVPFLNPLDRARKLHAPAWQSLLAILAGPLPGLLGGIAIIALGLVLPLPGWLLDVGGFAIIINAFHLLPFLPLDGGKVVDLLVFRDLPFLRPFFTGVSAGLVLAAWFFTQNRALLYMGIGMFSAMIWDFKMIRVVRGGRRLGWTDAADEDETLRRIFSGIHEEGNTGFFGDGNWHRQIEVLLAEVMRKRPGFLLRILGGAAYLAAWSVAILLIILTLGLSLSGGSEHRRRMAESTTEFRSDFPASTTPVTSDQVIPFRALEDKTTASMDTASLDHFDWPTASRVINAGMVHEETFTIWMNVLCSRMEKALQEGRAPEAARRAEMLLHARSSMEPAATLHIRQALWDSEQRTLDVVEQLSASGQLDAVTIGRLDARINALNQAPLPAVENRLLVDGNIWHDAGSGTAFEAPELLDGSLADTGVDEDHRFWRLAALRKFNCLNHAVIGREAAMATAAVARHWKSTKKVGQLPETLEGADQPLNGEAAYIMDFCEAHQRMTWRRITTLSALRLENHRLKKGSLPPTWNYSLPGGAILKLVPGEHPKLMLEDHRELAKLTPSWMSQLSTKPAPINHECPLNPGTPLSQK